jgi:hypothetical protein
MSIQSSIGSFENPDDPRTRDPPDPIEDGELKHHIAPDWAYPFPVEEVEGITELRKQIRDAVFADAPYRAWYQILKKELTYGNKKIANEVAIFNAGGAAHDCPNLGTEQCQVDAEDCYAVRSESNYPHPLSARRRERIIWTHLDPVTFARAFRYGLKQKRNDVSALRLNESGDFNRPQDIYKADEVARRLSDIVDTYTYSASSQLAHVWQDTDHLVVNQSNQRADFGHRGFFVVDSVEEIPESGIRCPHDLSDGDIKCGECRLCIDDSTETPDIFVKNFYAE